MNTSTSGLFIAPTELTDARLQAHWAAQLVMAVGDAYLEPRPDDSHSNMGWSDAYRALVGHPIDGGFKVALHLPEMTLLVLDGRDEIRDEHQLVGNAIDDGLQWMATRLGELGAGESERALSLRDYEMPDHPVARGTAFSREHPAAFKTLADWFAESDAALRAVVADEPHSEPVRCWPHHFDLGTLIVLDPDKGADSGRSVGLGLSPGDEGYDEPYYYVRAYPLSETPQDRPTLDGGGFWRTKGWFAAILTGSTIVSGGSNGRADRIRAFLDSAIRACKGFLGEATA
jgi:hypothetical protein